MKYFYTVRINENYFKKMKYENIYLLIFLHYIRFLRVMISIMRVYHYMQSSNTLRLLRGGE